MIRRSGSQLTGAVGNASHSGTGGTARRTAAEAQDGLAVRQRHPGPRPGAARLGAGGHARRPHLPVRQHAGAVGAGLWALAEQRTARRLRRALRATTARSKAAVGERDALLGAAREALVVWGRDGAGP